MRNLIGVLLIFILWLKVAELTRNFPFEVKLPAMIIMGLITLIIAYVTKLIDKKSCKKSQ